MSRYWLDRGNLPVFTKKWSQAGDDMNRKKRLIDQCGTTMPLAWSSRTSKAILDGKDLFPDTACRQ
jgi:hypothetical protein